MCFRFRFYYQAQVKGKWHTRDEMRWKWRWRGEKTATGIVKHWDAWMFISWCLTKERKNDLQLFLSQLPLTSAFRKTWNRGCPLVAHPPSTHTMYVWIPSHNGRGSNLAKGPRCMSSTALQPLPSCYIFTVLNKQKHQKCPPQIFYK